MGGDVSGVRKGQDGLNRRGGSLRQKGYKAKAHEEQEEKCNQNRAEKAEQSGAAKTTPTRSPVDVAVVDPSREANFWRLEGVICREVNVQEEDTAAVGAVIGTHDGRLPMKKIVPHRSSRAIGRWVVAKLLQLTGDALEGHSAKVCVRVRAVQGGGGLGAGAMGGTKSEGAEGREVLRSKHNHRGRRAERLPAAMAAQVVSGVVPRSHTRSCPAAPTRLAPALGFVLEVGSASAEEARGPGQKRRPVLSVDTGLLVIARLEGSAVAGRT